MTIESLYKKEEIFTNIKENKKLIKSINVFGKEISKHTKNQILFYIYNDGSVEKMFFN